MEIPYWLIPISNAYPKFALTSRIFINFYAGIWKSHADWSHIPMFIPNLP